MPVIGTGGPAGQADRWSPTGRSIPTTGASFSARRSTCGYQTGLGKVLVNWFESLVGQWMGKPAQICSLAPVCGRSLVTMEKDGSLYSCDHFVYPEYRLGNLLDDGCQLADVVYSPQQRRVRHATSATALPDYCRQCQYNFACNGECPKNRFLKTPDGQPGLNYLCSGIRRFLTHADPYLQQIVARCTARAQRRRSLSL